MKGELSSPSSFFDFSLFCEKLHPTAALGGYPAKKAFEWLEQEPTQKRKRFFGAPFGFFNGKDKAFCLVALRSLEWTDSETHIYSGGGLVKESNLQKEWRELFLKREQVKNLFS